MELHNQASHSRKIVIVAVIVRSVLSRLLDRQVGGASALENPPRIDSDLVIGTGKVGSIAYEPTRFDEIGPRKDGGHGVTRRQFNKLFTAAREKSVRADNECADPLLNKGCKGRLEITFGARSHDNDLSTRNPPPDFCFSGIGCGVRIVWVDDKANGPEMTDELGQELEPLRGEIGSKQAYTGHVGA